MAPELQILGPWNFKNSPLEFQKFAPSIFSFFAPRSLKLSPWIYVH